MIDSEIAFVIVNILKVNEPLVVPVPVRRLIVFDTNGVKEVVGGFRITHFYSAHPSLPSFLRSRDPPPPLSKGGKSRERRKEGKEGCVE